MGLACTLRRLCLLAPTLRGHALLQEVLYTVLMCRIVQYLLRTEDCVHLSTVLYRRLARAAMLQVLLWQYCVHGLAHPLALFALFDMPLDAEGSRSHA